MPPDWHGRGAPLIFCATVVTVYSLLFIVLTVQLPSGSGGLPMSPALPWQAWAFGGVVFGTAPPALTCALAGPSQV